MDSIADEHGAIRSSLSLYFALLAISVATMAALRISGRAFDFQADWIESVSMSCVILAWSVLGRSRLRGLLNHLSAVRWYFAAIGCAAMTFLFAHASVQVLQRYFYTAPIRYLPVYRHLPHSFAVAVLFVCIQPAIFEELAFRGFILSSLRRVLGNGEAVIVSAGMFAILHLSIPSIPHLFFIGAVLALLRLRSGSLYPGMLMHFTHNFLCILAEHHWRL